MLRDRGYSEPAIARLTWDRFGCLLHDVSGLRIDPRCRQGTRPDPRWICTSPRIATRDPWEDMAREFKSVAGLLIPLLPSIGPGLAELFGPIASELFSGDKSLIADLLGEELQRVAGLVGTLAESIWTSAQEAFAPAVATFQKLVSTAKTIVQALPSAIAGMLGSANGEIATLLGYVNVREGISFASGLLAAHAPSISMLQGLGVGVLGEVGSFREAIAARDVVSSLAGLQTTIASVERLTGSASLEQLRILGASLPDITTVAVPSGFPPIPELGIGPARELVGTLGGLDAPGSLADPSAILGRLDPAKLAALLPEADLRRTFDREMSRALDFQKALVPSIAEGEQAINRGLALAKTLTTNKLAKDAAGAFVLPAEVRALRGEALENLARKTLLDAEIEAETIVGSALGRLAPDRVSSYFSCQHC